MAKLTHVARRSVESRLEQGVAQTFNRVRKVWYEEQMSGSTTRVLDFTVDRICSRLIPMIFHNLLFQLAPSVVTKSTKSPLFSARMVASVTTLERVSPLHLPVCSKVGNNLAPFALERNKQNYHPMVIWCAFVLCCYDAWHLFPHLQEDWVWEGNWSAFFSYPVSLAWSCILVARLEWFSMWRILGPLPFSSCLERCCHTPIAVAQAKTA